MRVTWSACRTDREHLSPGWGTLPFHLLNHFASFGAVPRQVRVRTMLLEQLLQPLAEELGFSLSRSRTLRSLERAKSFMLDRFV